VDYLPSPRALIRRPWWLAIAIVFAEAANAQVQPELRVDVLEPRPHSVQPGVGAVVALGTYVRLGAVVGYALRGDSNLIGDRSRIDVLARVTLDPFRQQRRAFSIGGGVSIRRRTYLAVVMDLEGSEILGFIPALQLGVSGGARVGLILRRAIKGRR
jgi:hypothetical protein